MLILFSAYGLAAPPLASVIIKLNRGSVLSRIHHRARRARRDCGGDLPRNCHLLPFAATFAT